MATFTAAVNYDWWAVKTIYNAAGDEVIAYENNWGYVGLPAPDPSNGFPNATNAAIIPGGISVTNAYGSVDGLTIGGGATVTASGDFVAYGTFDIAGCLDMTNVDIRDGTMIAVAVNNMTFSGGGTIEFADSNFGGSEIGPTTGVSGITYTNYDTIEGAFHIGSSGAAVATPDTFINHGVVTANSSGGGASATFTGGSAGSWLIENDGTISATSGGTVGSNVTFQAASTTIQNYIGTNQGTISATGVASIEVANTTIEGGKLQTSSGAYFDFNGNDVLDGTAHAITVDAALDSLNGAGFTLKGTINFSADSSIAVSGGPVTLDGSGFDFVSGMKITSAELIGGTGADSATNAGLIDTSASITTGPGGDYIVGLTLTNTGVIDADSNSLVIGGASSSGVTDVVNENLVEATDDAVLEILGPNDAYSSGVQATTLDDSGGGKLYAADGSYVQIEYGATVKGGEIQTSGTGHVDIADALLDGTATSSLTIDTGSTINAAGTTIVDDIVNNGNITITANDFYVASGTSATLDGSGSVNLGGSYVEGGGALTVGANQTVQGSGAFADDAITNHGVIDSNASGTILFASGAATPTSIVNFGTVKAEIDSIVNFSNQYGGNVALHNEASGELTAYAGGEIEVATGENFVNAGKLFADGGIVSVSDAVTGSGSVEIDGGRATFDGAFNEKVTFDSGGGTLELAGGDLGTISGFQSGDVINVIQFPGGGDTLSHKSSNHTVTITSPDGTKRETFHFSATTDVSAIQMAPGANAANSAVDQLTMAAPCYVRGTRILTPRGEVAVEDLSVGDLVVTASGAIRPIVWIGHRNIDLVRHPQPELVRPVRLAAGALGENVPYRDLLVSPEHALWLENTWVPAQNLINGATIRQEAWSRVTYFHVELESHDILLAEGAPAESYLDCDNRHNFENAPDGMTTLRPDWQAEIDSRPPSPIRRLRAALAQRARELGRGRELDLFETRMQAPRTNFVANPRGEGGARGLLGAGGKAPDLWHVETPAGIAAEFVRDGESEGLPFVYLRFRGVAREPGVCRIFPQAEKTIAARRGEAWTMSCCMTLAGGSISGVETFALSLDEYGADESWLTGKAYRACLPEAGDLAPQRFQATRWLMRREVANAAGHIRLEIAAGALINLTLCVAAPQIERGAYASDILLPPPGAYGPTVREEARQLMTGLRGVG